MPVSRAIPGPESQPYVVHGGNNPGISCTFQLASPPRAKCIPYAYLQSIDTYSEKLITLRYTFADVELSLNGDFPGRRLLIEEFSNFRVALVREGKEIGIRILMEPAPEKPEIF
jgi:hypothetical protein